MNMKNGAGLGLAIHWLRQALISAYEDNSALRLVRTCRQSLKCTVELESFRREIRRSFNKCLSEKELYREVCSEIIPTRCNNCVYSSQWLYSTCFGRQFHPSSGVQCCIWPFR